MRSYDFIKMYKEKNNLPSDYKTAQMLGITRQSISLYKHGRPIDEDLALPIAESLGINPSEILIVLAEEKSKSAEAKKAWKMLSKLSKEAGSISTKLLFLLPFLSLMVANSIYYVKSCTKEQYA